MMHSPNTQLHHADLDESFLKLCRAEGKVAWDIETSGLDWRADRIATCQVAAGKAIAVVRFSGRERPERLIGLLEDKAVMKVFHHAPFDLRFMSYQWRASPISVACTKVASKILDPQLDNSEHSLMPILSRRLGIQISKAQQRSNWLAEELTAAQLDYAATDVRHLLSLLASELNEARQRGLEHLILQSFDYIPCRVALDLLGAGDVYAY
ncbi:hypothetical protein [Nocardia sienata]|uniref:hypothetical protein n=1 Tax=Nocardia sienata TaxID=248552 RepID=UPI0007A392E5|nr:hypothetical protein [Nocardia sienata]